MFLYPTVLLHGKTHQLQVYVQLVKSFFTNCMCSKLVFFGTLGFFPVYSRNPRGKNAMKIYTEKYQQGVVFLCSIS